MVGEHTPVKRQCGKEDQSAKGALRLFATLVAQGDTSGKGDVRRDEPQVLRLRGRLRARSAQDDSC